MPDFQLDPASGVRLIGAEMLFHEERQNVGEADVIADLTQFLMKDVGELSVALLGPRAASLLSLLPTSCVFDVLVRGLPDARVIAAQQMLHENLTVWCGGIDRFEPTQQFDLIIVLDDVFRLLSPDSKPVTHTELGVLVSNWLADDGRIIAQVSNGFSTEVLRDSGQRAASNDEWWIGSAGFEQRPLYWPEVPGTLAATGLHKIAAYSAYPSRDFPALLLNHDDELPLADVARGEAVRLQTALPERKLSLHEPVALVSDSIKAGQVKGLAPSWVFVLSKDDPGHEEVPALIVSDLRIAHHWRSTRIAVSDGDAYLWSCPTWRQARKGQVVQSGLLSRDLGLERPVSHGIRLHLHLRRAIVGGNFDSIRRVVRQYVGWLRTLNPKEAIFATPDNVRLEGDELSIVDRSWAWAAEPNLEVVLVHCLRHFSLSALRAGIAHPWRSKLSANELAVSLAAMAEVVTSPSVLQDAALLDAEIRAEMFDVSYGQREKFLDRAIAEAESAIAIVSANQTGFRELASKSTELTIELQTKNEQVSWLELSLRNRSAKLQRTEKKLASIQGSISYRIGRGLTWPLRYPAQLVQQRVKALIPRDLINRGIQTLKALGKTSSRPTKL